MSTHIAGSNVAADASTTKYSDPRAILSYNPDKPVVIIKYTSIINLLQIPLWQRYFFHTLWFGRLPLIAAFTCTSLVYVVAVSNTVAGVARSNIVEVYMITLCTIRWIPLSPTESNQG